MLSELRGKMPYRAAVLVALALFAAAAFLVSLRVGSLKLSLGDLLEILWGGGAPMPRRIIMNIRVPRSIAALLVGASLAVSGAILQGVMRNPLAAPNLIGVSSGAGLAAITVMILLPQLYLLLVPAAFLGALGATAIIYLLAWKRGVKPTRIILAGVAVSSLLGAWTNALMIFFPDKVSGVVGFLVGGLSGRSWKQVNMLWPYTIAGLAAAVGLAGRLNILALGDDTATGLGLRVELVRALLIAVSAMLAGAAVSVAGLLGFVGLIAPHMTRLMIGSDYRYLMPASALFGAGLVALCDTIGRVIMDPVELPVGIIMSAFGAPVFLYLLKRKARDERA